MAEVTAGIRMSRLTYITPLKLSGVGFLGYYDLSPQEWVSRSAHISFMPC